MMLCIVEATALCSICCLLFFFFKQKTAYEMRISDWSSDVCSSDLLFRIAADRQTDAGRPAHPVRTDTSRRCHKLLRCIAGSARHQLWQIGRASCRERVCKYV